MTVRTIAATDQVAAAITIVAIHALANQLAMINEITVGAVFAKLALAQIIRVLKHIRTGRHIGIFAESDQSIIFAILVV